MRDSATFHSPVVRNTPESAQDTRPDCHPAVSLSTEHQNGISHTAVTAGAENI